MLLLPWMTAGWSAPIQTGQAAAACAGAVQSTPMLMVASPAAGDTWPVGTARSIIWSSLDYSGHVRIDIATPNFATPAAVVTITLDTPNTGVYCWRVLGSNLQTGSYQLRVMPAAATETIPAPGISGIFSIVAAHQTLTVSTPAENAVWPVGTDQIVTWLSSGVTGNLRIELLRRVGSTIQVEMLFDNVPLFPPQKRWTVTGTTSGFAQIKLSSIVDPFVTAVSPAFVILAPGQVLPSDSGGAFCCPGAMPFKRAAQGPFLRVDSPLAGDLLVAGTTRSVFWTSNGLPPAGKVRLDLSTDSGQTFPIVIAESAENNLGFEWTVPPAGISDKCRIRISSLESAAVTAVSYADFTIAPPGLPALQLLVPDGGEVYSAGSAQRLRWRSAGATGATVRIDFSSDGGNSFTPLVTGIVNNTDRIWTVSNVQSDRCRIRIVSEQPNLGRFISDVSNCDFQVK
ncbi:MAG: hypothetical protein HY650_14045 [Acidobacteria bacterium]|nr:hypothetical protein [Acidobacteriota bacterium]